MRASTATEHACGFVLVAGALLGSGCETREAASPRLVAITLAPPSIVASAQPNLPTPRPKREVRCEVVSEDLPAETCIRYGREVVDGKGTTIARLEGPKTKTTLDLSSLPHAIGVTAESSKLVVKGELVKESTWLYLTRPSPALSSHVTLWRGAPVRAVSLEGAGVLVSAYIGFNGLDTIDAEVGCDALSFGDIARLPIEGTPGVTKDVYAPIGAITLLSEPDGRALGTIDAGDSTSNLVPATGVHIIRWPANLVLRERRAQHSRFTFDATFATFDVWIRDAEVKVALPRGFGGGRGCGGGKRGVHGPRYVVDRPTDLHMGSNPKELAPVGVTLKPNAEVEKLQSKDGMSRIYVYDDPIEPPKGKDYYVTDSALRLSTTP